MGTINIANQVHKSIVKVLTNKPDTIIIPKIRSAENEIQIKKNSRCIKGVYKQFCKDDDGGWSNC